MRFDCVKDHRVYTRKKQTVVNMTMSVFFESVIKIVSDLARDVPDKERYQNLISAVQRIFPCDAAVLLRLEGRVLRPLAVSGLESDVMGRRFVVDEHPRLSRIVNSRTTVRFEADSTLPDPYDGLISIPDGLLNIHDCMGFSLYVDDKPWGVLTLDALADRSFDSIDPTQLRMFINLTEATVKAAERIALLKARVKHSRDVVVALQSSEGRDEIIGDSQAIHTLLADIDVVAFSSLTVLIMGETGVGKELVAKRIHAKSSRANAPMVHVNCAALPESLAESELFGHVRGAFTGAVTDRAGRFELANGGTLFLDEIGELPLSLQAKILRTLQSGEVQRVGSDHNIQVDVRIVAATNRNLQEEIVKGRFRADLYHRIAVYPVTVPPLRGRDTDILLLAGFFLERNQRRLGVGAFRLSKAAKLALQQYSWPGNVRELEHLLSRAGLRAIAEQGRDAAWVTLSAEHLDFRLDAYQLAAGMSVTVNNPVVAENRTMDMNEAVDQFQKDLIQQRLEDYQGNLAATARSFDLNSSNFYRLLKRLHIK